jgi:hypothetical protein
MYLVINELTGAVISRHRTIKDAQKGQIRYAVRIRSAGIPHALPPTSIRHADGTRLQKTAGQEER